MIKKLIGCHQGFIMIGGKTYEMDTISGAVRYHLADRARRLREWPRNFLRWTLAGWLRYLAAKCRGDKWYVADTWHGVPGNRVAELKQQIWLECVTADVTPKEEFLEAVDGRLNELAQLAGECWGHVWPKEEKK